MNLSQPHLADPHLLGPRLAEVRLPVLRRSVLEVDAGLRAWWQVRLTRALGLDRSRDERGNNSIEMAIIVGVVIVVAGLIVVAIKAAVESRLPGMK